MWKPRLQSTKREESLDAQVKMVLLIVLNAEKKPHGLKNLTRCEDAGTADNPQRMKAMAFVERLSVSRPP
tara:strand:+ start:242 stop:451 length:210 start_codon:yes stop_codon:yes gene_type:complete